MSTGAADERGELQASRVRRRDEVLRRWGIRAWMFVGTVAGAAIVSGVFGAISGLMVLLVVAVVIFGSTIVGGATPGLLGAALSTPAVAIMVRVGRRLTALREELDGDDGR